MAGGWTVQVRLGARFGRKPRPLCGAFVLHLLSSSSYRAVLPNRPRTGRQSVPGGGQGKAKVDAELVQKCCHFRAAKSSGKRAARVTFPYHPLQVLKNELSQLEVRGLLGSVYGSVALGKAKAAR